jgi:membrane fusion protein (multidrug efflux system)
VAARLGLKTLRRILESLLGKRGGFLKKQMTIMLLLVGVFFGVIFGWKEFNHLMNQYRIARQGAPVITVSTMLAKEALWQPALVAVGSLRARLGVNVTTELAGMVETISFTPGAAVKQGDLLVQLNAAPELGQLHSLQAQVELAKITYIRDQAQYAAHAVSKQTLDTDFWTLKNLQAQVEEQAGVVAKKTIRAPFSGQLGINQVNPGQYLNTGDVVTALQTLDPLYADFYLPQQDLALVNVGQKIQLTVDTYPDKKFDGMITTIQPMVDTSNRNVQVEATIPNPDALLKPGLFTQVTVHVNSQQQYVTLPHSALTFNSYGTIVYVVKRTEPKAGDHQPEGVVTQTFVTVGATRAEQIAIINGVKPGDEVVTSGQLKLKNGSHIKVNNKLQPDGV